MAAFHLPLGHHLLGHGFGAFAHPVEGETLVLRGPVGILLSDRFLGLRHGLARLVELLGRVATGLAHTLDELLQFLTQRLLALLKAALLALLLLLAKLLFAAGDRHITAEQLHGEAVSAEVPVSLATVYNSLHQFTEAGLLREVVVEPGRSYFDTNVSDHHHFYFEDSGELQDIPGEHVQMESLPAAPAGTRVARVDVIIRLSDD